MAMQQRERMLALALGLTVGVVLVYWGVGRYRAMFTGRETQVSNLTTEVSNKETKVALINKAIAQRRELEKRSLPTNRVDAQNLYQDWLFKLVNGKLTSFSVTPRDLTGKPKGHIALGFDVKGQGSLEQITKLLHDFYSEGHLHQITHLDIQPQPKGGNLDLTMKVEAIILPGADRKDRLATEKGNSLALNSYNDYQKAITERNLFAEYTPTVKPAGVPLDLAKLAKLTYTGHGIDQRPMGWIYEPNLNKITKLFEGDEFQIAGLKGKVKQVNIDDRAVVLEIDGKTLTLDQYKSLGDTLAEAKTGR